MPLSSSNLSMIGPTSSSLRPEYTTSDPSSDAEPASDAEPPCESDPSPDSSCPHPVPARATSTKSARTTRDLFQDRAKLLLSNATPEIAGERSSRWFANDNHLQWTRGQVTLLREPGQAALGSFVSQI